MTKVYLNLKRLPKKIELKDSSINRDITKVEQIHLYAIVIKTFKHFYNKN